jgi:hypothetical protein
VLIKKVWALLLSLFTLFCWYARIRKYTEEIGVGKNEKMLKVLKKLEDIYLKILEIRKKNDNSKADL